jgi:cytochrome c551/c552
MSRDSHRDDDLHRSILLGVVIGAIALMLTLIAYTIGYHTGQGTAPAPTTAASAPPSGSTGPSSAAAQQVFTQSGCSGCHTFAPAGATGTIGPDLATAGKAAIADHKMPLAAYIRQSIVDPNAYIPPGYHANLMPTYYGTKLTSTQIQQLVTYIASGQTK